MKSGFYTTTSKAQLSGWIEKKHQSTSQSQTCTKKRSQWLFGGLLPIQSTTVFWILVKPLRSILSKSMRWTKNCNACSQYWSTEWAVLLHDDAQPHIAKPTLQKLNGLLQSFASFIIFTWPLANWLALLQISRQLFAGKHFHNQQEE